MISDLLAELTALADGWHDHSERLHSEAAALNGLNSTANRDRINAKLCTAIGFDVAERSLRALIAKQRKETDR